ncbi:hypothetical protein WJ438_38205 [Streptomyces sp. GD-15H]
MLFADQLADVDLTDVSHVRGTGIADVGVVRPYDPLGLGAVVLHETVQCVGHVVVADVPGLGAALQHGPVIAFGAGQHFRVLPGGELRERAVQGGCLRGPSAQLGEQADDLRFAALGQVAGGQGISLRILGIRLEAAVRLQSVLHPVGVVLAQVVEHRVQGVPQAVDVQPEEPDTLLGCQLLVVPAQPPGERDHVRVGPHPRRPAPETRQHLLWILRCTRRRDHRAVHGLTVGPVAFHGDEGETLLRDQPTGQHVTDLIVVSGPVGRLAQQHVAGVTDAVEQRVQRRRIRQRERRCPDTLLLGVGHSTLPFLIACRTGSHPAAA